MHDVPEFMEVGLNLFVVAVLKQGGPLGRGLVEICDDRRYRRLVRSIGEPAAFDNIEARGVLVFAFAGE